MLRKRHAYAAATLCACLLGVTAEAAANDQAWLADRQLREGAGFRVGNFELHPGLGADFGYDSNFLRRDSTEGPVGSLRLRVAPSFSVATLGPQRSAGGAPPDFGFRFDVKANYNEFIPVSGDQLSKDRLSEQRNFGGTANIELEIKPKRTWSGRLYGGITRTVRPTNEADLSATFNRVLPNAGADLTFRPGTGLLDWRLGYNFSGTFFETGAFGGLNSMQHEVSTRGRWRFLPRTALVYDASFGFLLYDETVVSAAAKTDSFPVRTKLGINGLITPSFLVKAMVGWGAGFYTQDDQDFDSVIGQLELRWYLSGSSNSVMHVPTNQKSISIGFIRDFADSFLGTYLERDQGYAQFNYMFGRSFLLSVEGRAGAVVFPNQTGPDYGNPDGWTDMRVDGKIFGEYRIKDYLGITADLTYTGYFSSTALTFGTGPGQDNMRYQRFAAFLGARWFM